MEIIKVNNHPCWPWPDYCSGKSLGVLGVRQTVSCSWICAASLGKFLRFRQKKSGSSIIMMLTLRFAKAGEKMFGVDVCRCIHIVYRWPTFRLTLINHFGWAGQFETEIYTAFVFDNFAFGESKNAENIQLGRRKNAATKTPPFWAHLHADNSKNQSCNVSNARLNATKNGKHTPFGKKRSST